MRYLIILLALGISSCGKEEAAPQAVSSLETVFSSFKHCSVINSGLLFQYNINTYSTGDVQVVCSISDSSAQYSYTNTYKSGTNGASTGGCTLTYDLDTSSGGYFSFANGTSVVATYKDTGSASHNVAVTLTSCTTN